MALGPRSSVVSSKSGVVCCAPLDRWQGARVGVYPQRYSTARATQPAVQWCATLRAAGLFRPDFVARSSQIHYGICSSLAPRLAGKYLATYYAGLRGHHTRLCLKGRPRERLCIDGVVPEVGIAPTSPRLQRGANLPQLLGAVVMVILGRLAR